MGMAYFSRGWAQLFILFAGVALTFCYFGGLTIVDPTNLSWFNRGDPRQHLLGWLFYRETPLWQFPLGLNPEFGEATSGTIVFSDSLPLFAVLFKLLNPILPENFQYFGLWICLCFVLQAVFGRAVLLRLGVGPWAAVFGGLLLLASPIMLWRLHGHEALVGQWMILAGIYLYLLPRFHIAGWVALVGVATGFHAYLLGMVGGVFLADVIARRGGWLRSALHMALITGTVGVTAWVLGYFEGASGRMGGFGLYRTTLHSWIDTDSQWSRIMPDIHGKQGTYEGFAYLGLGAILLLLAAVALKGLVYARQREAVAQVAKHPSLRPLIWMAVAYSLFALSYKVGGFGIVFFDMDIFKHWHITSIFRASGRFVWMPTYLMIILAIAFLARNLPARAMTAGLALVFAVQIADIHPAAAYFREKFATPAQTHFTAPFWDEAVPRYKRISLWPREADVPDVLEAGYLAVKHGISVDLARLARRDPKATAAAETEVMREIATADWREDTLYILREGTPLAHLPLNDPNTLIAAVNGVTVVAPGWEGSRDDLGLEAVALPPAPALPADGKIEFRTGGNADPYLGFGWSGAEPSGRWTIGSSANLRVSLPPAQANTNLRLTLKTRPLITSQRNSQPVGLLVNGHEVYKSTLTPENTQTPIEISVPATAVGATGALNMRFEIGHPSTPGGNSQDTRLLGMFVDYLLIGN